MFDAAVAGTLPFINIFQQVAAQDLQMCIDLKEQFYQMFSGAFQLEETKTLYRNFLENPQASDPKPRPPKLSLV
jgi:hypothetical protein